MLITGGGEEVLMSSSLRLDKEGLPKDSLTSLVTSLTTILFRSVTVTSKFFHSSRLSIT